MDISKIITEINHDVDTGLYENHEKLKKRLLYISEKLVKSIYIEDLELSTGEINTLQESGYLD